MPPVWDAVVCKPQGQGQGTLTKTSRTMTLWVPRTAGLATRGLASAASGSTARPFRVLGLQQVAIGGLDKGPLTDLWQRPVLTHTPYLSLRTCGACTLYVRHGVYPRTYSCVPYVPEAQGSLPRAGRYLRRTRTSTGCTVAPQAGPARCREDGLLPQRDRERRRGYPAAGQVHSEE